MLSYSPTFNVAFQQLLILEGGYINDESDPGGETKYGISKRAYPLEDIQGLTIERAQALYYRDFWGPLKCDSIFNHSIAIEVFQSGVNLGGVSAVKIVQHAINALGSAQLVEDGIMGLVTLSFLNAYAHPDDLLKVMSALQLCRYVEIAHSTPSLKKFLRGWIKRIQ